MDIDCWAEELSLLGTDLAAAGADMAAGEPGRPGVAARGVTIAFGGHFSCGKSTIINAALGRDLLSADNYPETGAICVIAGASGATKDMAFATAGTKRWEIPCSTDAIRGHVARISDEGATRTEFEVVDRLDLFVAGGGPNDGGRWIDTPGINDDASMDDRAREAAGEADLVAWVVSSRQPLSEIELDFLTSHVAGHGPESIVFIVNVFLNDDTPEAWAEWCATSRPTVAARIGQYGAKAGISNPLVVMVSGRAAAAGIGDEMGGLELRGVLGALGRYHHPRVVATRLRPVLAGLERMRTTVWEKLTSEQHRVEVAQAAEFDRRVKRAAAQRTWFESYVGTTVHAFVEQATNVLTAATSDIVGMINLNTLRRDGFYGETLTARFTDALRGEVDTLARHIWAAAEPLCQRPLFPDDLGAVGQILVVPPLQVPVPNSALASTGGYHNLREGASKVADLGSAGRVLVTKAERMAAGHDAVEAQAAARAAGAAMIAHVRSSAAAVTGLILERCCSLPIDTVESAADERRLAALRRQNHQLTAMIERAPWPQEVGSP